MDCVGGSRNNGLMRGMDISDLFERAKPNGNATTAIFYCSDGYMTTHPIQDLVETEAFLAYEVYGAEYPKFGFPLRLVAPGKQESAYTLQKHVKFVTALVEHLGLHQLITVGGDWGGPISLRYAIEHQDNVSALVILGTVVRPIKVPLIFRVLFLNGGISSFLIKNLDLFRRTVYSRIGFKRPMDARAMEQYKMPHLTATSRAGIATFPSMIPSNARHPNWDYILEIERTIAEWDLPVLVMFADKDMVFKVEEGQRIANLVPNGRFHLVQNAGHFSPEDAGEEMAERLVSFLRYEAMIGR